MNWEPGRAGRLTRRRFLGLGAAAVGAGGVLAACGGGSSARTATPSALATDDAEPTVTQHATPGSTRAPLSERHGETLRYTGFVRSDQGYDPHRIEAGPLLGQQSMVFSRLLSYQDQAEGTLVPDLASAMPEQPDGQTFVFRLNPAARWQQQAPLAGRALTADDVRYSFQRQQQGDITFISKPHWVNIDTIEATDPATVTVKLKAPLAMMPGWFADTGALIVAPELGDAGFSAENQVGSGPFQWVEWNEGKFASVSRNPAWHGGNQRPYLDGVDLSQPTDADEVEALLRVKSLDVAFLGQPQADRLASRLPQLAASTFGRAQFFGMRFVTIQYPWNDIRLRAAVTIAIDRRGLVQRIFNGAGDLSPWVSWPVTRWTLPQSELTNAPGYRAGDGGRAADIADAKAYLAAYTAEKTPPEEIPLFVIQDTEATLGLGEYITEQIESVLGLNVRVYPIPVSDLAKRINQGELPWAAGPDTGPLDLDDWLYPYFHSEGTKNSFALRDPDIDALITAQRGEFDEAKRREVGFEAQRKLLALHAGVNFASERVTALSWPYVKGFPLDIGDGYQQRFADCWLDRNDASFRGR